MARSPDIATARLRLTPFAERHLTDRYVNWLNDRELMRYSEQRHKTHTVESCRSYWQSFAGTPHFFWAIEISRPGTAHIGNLNAYVDVNNRVADMGILLAPDAQGRGYGLEAWVGAAAFLLFQEDIRKVTAGMLALNGPMIELAQRAGMVEDGVRRRHCLCRGEEVDVRYFALFRETAETTARERQWARYGVEESGFDPAPGKAGRPHEHPGHGSWKDDEK